MTWGDLTLVLATAAAFGLGYYYGLDKGRNEAVAASGDPVDATADILSSKRAYGTEEEAAEDTTDTPGTTGS